MIKNTILHTINSTHIVRTPRKSDNFPFPTGTGFFITGDGFFITANHVINEVEDFSKVIFTQPSVPPHNGAHIQYIKLIKSWKEFDLALLKADFKSNKDDKKESLRNKDEFDYLDIAFEDQLEGTQVYSYAYPLSDVKTFNVGNAKIGFENLSPRTTSAIISSRYIQIKWNRGANEPKFYVLDTMLIFGNSGGPIIISETGNVFAVAIAFQTINWMIKDEQTLIPLNYSVVSSLNNIQDYLIDNIL